MSSINAINLRKNIDNILNFNDLKNLGLKNRVRIDHNLYPEDRQKLIDLFTSQVILQLKLSDSAEKEKTLISNRVADWIDSNCTMQEDTSGFADPAPI
ncbi:hypothetical protein [Candidatus Neptunochlamydia vexilliferae]|uniref:Uncharacterized protein n=1 Tax=Candidatus Neptunichlamydia vexilliferae TaxID=1651774 RepID=A0ABS0AYC9_9BACT|nr:hypothetical protein [Candidatus Neptunochlamydia vexilliferae]MBF5059126.1 hypothetical protein [Candidatus Neptunochlamydia vexilliferae]